MKPAQRTAEPGTSAGVSLTALLQDWSAHEADAVSKLHREYFPRLRALSTRTLRGLAGAATEAEDVVQSAFHSLCRFMRAQPENAGRDRSDMWRLLCHLVACKSRRRVQRQTRGLRGGRVRTMTDLEHPDHDRRVSDMLAEVSADDFDMLAAEALEGLDDPLRRIALLAMEGYTQQEIAERLDCSRRTIIRKLELIRESLKDLSDR